MQTNTSNKIRIHHYYVKLNDYGCTRVFAINNKFYVDNKQSDITYIFNDQCQLIQETKSEFHWHLYDIKKINEFNNKFFLVIGDSCLSQCTLIV